MENFIPKYIKQTVSSAPGYTVSSERWNELWTLNIEQGDYNSKALATLIAEFNQIIPEHSLAIANMYTKVQVDGFLQLKIDATLVYTKTEVDSIINNKIVELGAGDLTKAVYDTNNDGGVDSADEANNAQTANNGVFTYTHTVSGTTHTLTGSGANGKFKATASGTVSAFTINGTACTVVQGDENEIELISGNWYSFILDGTTINFNRDSSAMPKAGGIFTGAVQADAVIRAGDYLRNINVKTSDASADVPTMCIYFTRK